MRKRWNAAVLASLALAACSADVPPSDNTTGDVQVDDGKADCAIGANADWAHDCLIDRVKDTLTLRHPDGGFRRFHIVGDGRGVIPADGAEQAKLTITGNRQIEVKVGDDRYRLPATIAGQAR